MNHKVRLTPNVPHFRFELSFLTENLIFFYTQHNINIKLCYFFRNDILNNPWITVFNFQKVKNK